MNTGQLILIPTPLGEEGFEAIPMYVREWVQRLDVFIAERAKTARRFIKACQHPRPLQELTIHELNKHTPPEEISLMLDSLKEGHSVGLLSEAGCPGIADPGAVVVRRAHELEAKVLPLVGPSSIVLALMASGLSGQQFAFHGYLPHKKPDLQKRLRSLEQDSARFQQTQLFIETPYRNEQLLEVLLESLQPGTALCIASELTQPQEFIRTRTIQQWQKSTLPDLKKHPTVFCLYAGKDIQL